MTSMRKPVGAILLLVASVLISCSAEEEAQPGGVGSTKIEADLLDVAGGQIYYESAGSGEAVVFIHGNVGDRRHWDAQFLALADKFHVIRFDLRGFGQSSLPVEGEPYADYDDMAALLTHLGEERAHVVGWSKGSGIAFDFALAYPEKTLSVTSVGPWINGYTSPVAQKWFAEFAGVRSAARAGDLPAAVDTFMNALSLGNTINEPPAQRLREIALDQSFWHFRHRSPNHAVQPWAAQRVGNVKAPTLILTAEHDLPTCLEIADLLDEGIADSHKVVLKGASHLLHMEKPEEFNRTLIDFLQSL